MSFGREKVLRCNIPNRQQVTDALAADWTRVFPPSSRGLAAETLGCSRGTLNNGASGKHLPELDTALATLMLDRTALQAVLALYGLKAVPLVADAANDLSTMADLSSVVAKWAKILEDGVRIHTETCDLADSLRPLIPALAAIIAEADRLKGAA